MSYTEQQLEEMIASGDEAQEAQALEILSGGGNAAIQAEENGLNPESASVPVQEVQQTAPVETPVAPEQPQFQTQQPDVPQQQVAPVDTPAAPAPEQNAFTINYGGQEVQISDPDGYMGRKDLDGLKNQNGHQQKHIEWLTQQQKQQDDAARAEIQRIAQERDELRRKYEEMQKSGTNLYQAPQQPTTPLQQPVAPLQQPVAPQQPTQTTQPVSLPSDIYEWDENNTQVLNQKLGQVDQLQTQLQQVLAAQEEVNRKSKELEEMKAKQEQERRAEEEQKAWVADVNSFTQQHEKYKSLGEDITKYDSSVAAPWMDQIAAANGVVRPWDMSEAAQKNYDDQKNFIAQRYMQGDPIVKQKASVVPEPAGIKEYFEVSNLIQKQNSNEYLHYDRNGNPRRMNLQDLWVLEQSRNGNLQNGMNGAMEQARKEGAQAMANVQGSVANHAVNLSNTASQSNSQPSEVNITNMTEAQMLDILKSDPVRRERDPELMKQYNAVSQYVESMMN